MLFWKRVTVGHNERVLLFRHNRFLRIFTPGEHIVAGLAHTMHEERYNVLAPIFASEWVDYLVKFRPGVIAAHFILVETSHAQIAIIFLDGKLYRTIGPGTRILFWKGYRTVTVELVNVNDKPEIDRDRIPALTKLGRQSLAVFTTVDENKAGLLYLDGKFVQVLGPGVRAHTNRPPPKCARRWPRRIIPSSSTPAPIPFITVHHRPKPSQRESLSGTDVPGTPTQ